MVLPHDTNPTQLACPRIIIEGSAGQQEIATDSIVTTGVRGIAGIPLRTLVEYAQADPGAIMYFLDVPKRDIPPKPSQDGSRNPLHFADERIRIYQAERVITVDGIEIPHTPLMFSLCALFAINTGIVLSRRTIAKYVWDQKIEAPVHNVGPNISLLRHSLGPSLGDKKNGAIRTVKGIGYKSVRSLLQEAS